MKPSHRIVLNSLQAGAPQTATALATKTGLSYSTVCYALRDLGSRVAFDGCPRRWRATSVPTHLSSIFRLAESLQP